MSILLLILASSCAGCGGVAESRWLVFLGILMGLIRFALLLSLNASVAAAFEVGDRVAVVREAKLVVMGESARTVDSVSPGQVLTVLAKNGSQVMVSRGRPGWIESSAVLPLSEAEAVIQAKFKTGAGPADYLARGNIRIAQGNTEAGLADLEKAVQ